jgi:hypothetical protein
MVKSGAALCCKVHGTVLQDTDKPQPMKTSHTTVTYVILCRIASLSPLAFYRCMHSVRTEGPIATKW